MTRRLDAVLLLVALVWGASYLAAKDATAALPVLVVLALRYAISAAACVPLLAVRRRGRTPAPRTAVVLGTTQTAVLVLETYGVAHTSAANAGVLISLTILLTPLLATVLDRDAVPPRFFAAVAVSLAGIALLLSGDGLSAPRAGDLLILAAAVVRAGHVVLLGRLTAGTGVDPLRLTAGQLLVGTALLLPLAAADGHALAGPVPWGALLFLALGCSVFAFLAQTWAVQRSSPSRASLLLGTEPVWAVLVGVAVGGEHVGPVAALGAAVVVGGTYWGSALERRHRAARRVRPTGDPAGLVPAG